MAMKREEVLDVLGPLKGDRDVSVATMQVVNGWYRNDGGAERHINGTGCMGMAGPLGLGVALAQPDRKVLVLDGDGSLTMQLGSLASVSGLQPENFYHLVFVNRVYETSGRQPIPGAERIDFAGMAKATGYRVAESFDDIGVLRERLPALLNEPGPVMVAFEVEVEMEPTSPPAKRPPMEDQMHVLRSQIT